MLKSPQWTVFMPSWPHASPRQPNCGQTASMTWVRMSLFWLSLRIASWQVRMGTLKKMAQLFHAFDRPNYMELTAMHFADVWQLPPAVLQHLEKGAFTASITGSCGRNVGLDEAHECVANRQLKAAIHSSDEQYVEQVAQYLPFRATLQENFRKQAVQRKDDGCTQASSQANQGNVRAMCTKLMEVRPFDIQGGLQNAFTGKQATSAEERGMLGCHSVGEARMKAYFSSRVLHKPSVPTPVRQERLQTMGSTTRVRTRSPKTKPHQTMVLALKAQLVQAQRENAAPTIRQQVYLLPKALVNDDGNPRKGVKSVSRKVLVGRYRDQGVMSSTVPSGVTGDKSNTIVVIDGMFLLQSTPLGHHSLVADYILFLLSRWVKPMFGLANNVHLLWDDPGRHGPSAKEIERQRRDAASSSNSCTQHCSLSLNSKCPNKDAWQRMIACRTCKRSILQLVACGSLLLVQALGLEQGQVFLTAGSFNGDMRDKAWSVTAGQMPRPDPGYTSNHEEADTRVWLHACKFKRAIIYSPDSDTFMVGLPLLDEHDLKVAVRLDMPGSKERQYLDLNRLYDCVQRDPDLSAIPPHDRANAILAWYVASGCDFTSFFAGLGKATTFKALHQHAPFIAESGSLHSDFLAFIRLMVSAYYCRYRSVFHSSPADLFAEFAHTGTPEKQHKTFLAEMQTTIWPRTTSEEQCIPGWTALRLHWQRMRWVLKVWGQATSSVMIVPDLTEHGWKVDEDGAVTVMWDTPESMEAVQTLLDSLTSGCKCKTGCSTHRCKCFKGNRACSSGCRCRNCTNINAACSTTSTTRPTEETAESSDGSSTDESEGSDLEACWVSFIFPFFQRWQFTHTGSFFFLDKNKLLFQAFTFIRMSYIFPKPWEHF